MITRPSDADLVNFHLTCLQGTYFNTRSVADGWLTAISDLITDYYYNFVTPLPAPEHRSLPPPSFDRLLSSKRSPTLYVSPLASRGSYSPANLGLEHVATDAWLGKKLSASSAPLTAGASIIQSDLSQVSDYIGVFEKAYSGTDPDDPYGTLEYGYRNSLRQSLTVSPPFGFTRYDVLLRVPGENAPASIGAVYVSGALAGIYGVGTDPRLRKQGYGEAVTLALEGLASTAGASYVFLQTEAGSEVQNWYESQSYSHLFDAEYHSSQS